MNCDGVVLSVGGMCVVVVFDVLWIYGGIGLFLMLVVGGCRCMKFVR